MSAFKDRIFKATEFEKEVFSELKGMGFDIAVNGTEHTYPEFVNLLRQSKDQTSLAIRFQPDAVICFGGVPHSSYIEAKASKYIEKDAYLQYHKLQDNGNTVILVFEGHDKGWNGLDKIKLIDGHITTKDYKRPFPVDNAGWIYPRNASHWGELEGRNAAGTPYKEVDKSSLEPWMFFKSMVSDLLNAKG